MSVEFSKNEIACLNAGMSEHEVLAHRDFERWYRASTAEGPRDSKAGVTPEAWIVLNRCLDGPFKSEEDRRHAIFRACEVTFGWAYRRARRTP